MENSGFNTESCKMKKILLIGHSSDATGGGEEDFLKLLKYLYGKYYIIAVFPEGEKNLEYISFCNEYKIIKSTVFPFTEFKIRSYFSYFIKNMSKIPQLFSFIAKYDNIDVCYINSSVCFIDAIIVYLFGIPYVLSIKEKIEPRVTRKIISLLYALTAKKIFTLSKILKNTYENDFKYFNTEVIYSVLDEHYYKAESLKVEPFNKVGNCFTILNIGSIYPLKGQDILVEAVKDICLQEKYCVKFIGEVKNNEYYNELIKKINDYNLKDHVVLAGKMEKENVINEIIKSDVIVITSLFEGQSLVLLEGLFLGKPLITTMVGIVAEIIKDNINGLLVNKNDPIDLRDKIILLKSNITLQEKLIKEGKKTYTKNFSYEESLKKIEHLLIKSAN